MKRVKEFFSSCVARLCLALLFIFSIAAANSHPDYEEDSEKSKTRKNNYSIREKLKNLFYAISSSVRASSR